MHLHRFLRTVCALGLASAILSAEDAVAPAAAAELSPATPFKTIVTALDTDSDGVFAPAEIAAATDPELRGKLLAFDLDGDRALSEHELDGARKGWGADREGRAKKEKKGKKAKPEDGEGEAPPQP